MTDLYHTGSQGDNMPTISVEQSLLRELVEAKGRKHNIEDLAFRLPLMGTDIDSCDDEKLDIDFFPDRPDLLSPETLFYGMMPFCMSLHQIQIISKSRNNINDCIS